MVRARPADNFARSPGACGCASRYFHQLTQRDSCGPWARCKHPTAADHAPDDHPDLRLLDDDYAAACFSLLHWRGVLVLHSYFFVIPIQSARRGTHLTPEITAIG